jgi:hypothetical protein
VQSDYRKDRMDCTDSVCMKDIVAGKPFQVYWNGSPGVDLKMLVQRVQAELPEGTQVFGCRECTCGDREVCCYWLVVRLLKNAVALEIEDAVRKIVEELDGGTAFAEALQREKTRPDESQVCPGVVLDDEEDRPTFYYCAVEKNSAEFVKELVTLITEWKDATHFCQESFTWFGKLEFTETLQVCWQAEENDTSASMISCWL